jgi:alkylation response protein AidB-like acyl-CoA dehydrogenase
MAVDFRDSPAEAEFRQRLRRWIGSQLPFPQPPSDGDEYEAYLRRWHKTLYEARWIGLTFPTEYGGAGLDATYDAILLAELGAAGAPPFWKSGFVARTILLYGNEDLKSRFLPPALRSDERWCQGFSEPDAGSDLASIKTRALLDGDSYVIDGQKVWTSDAKWADNCLLLARSEPDLPKHKGLSIFIVPIDTPGVTVRPFANAIASLEFAEVFFDEVRIPVELRLGSPGDGWRIAMSTLSFERGPADNGFIAEQRRALNQFRTAAQSEPLDLDACDMERLGRSLAAVDVLSLRVAQSLWRRVQDIGSDAESSIDKLLMTATDQELARTLLDIGGPARLLGDSSKVLQDYLWSRAASIYGGTSQIQRNVVASRLLGLPTG